MASMDPALEALSRIPVAMPDDIDPEELAEVEAIIAEMKAGRIEVIPQEEITRTIAAMRPLAG
jgi:hypothetical protein